MTGHTLGMVEAGNEARACTLKLPLSQTQRLKVLMYPAGQVIDVFSLMAKVLEVFFFFLKQSFQQMRIL